MSIDPLFSQKAFDPEMTAILAAAFETAWERIKRSGSPLAADAIAAATRESLAKHIVEAAKAGERDHNRLVDDALSRMAIDPQPRPSAGARDRPD
jgi:hypothetical protein